MATLLLRSMMKFYTLRFSLEFLSYFHSAPYGQMLEDQRTNAVPELPGWLGCNLRLVDYSHLPRIKEIWSLRLWDIPTVSHRSSAFGFLKTALGFLDMAYGFSEWPISCLSGSNHQKCSSVRISSNRTATRDLSFNPSGRVRCAEVVNLHF